MLSYERKFSPSGDSKRRSNYKRGNYNKDMFSYNKIMYTRKVAKTVKGGKNMSFYVIAVVGNYTNTIGVASGRSRTIAGAIDKAFSNAKRDAINPGKMRNMVYSYCATKLILGVRKDTVIHSSNYLSEVFLAAGYKNVNCKIIGSRNSVNTIFGLFNAFKEIQRMNKIDGSDDYQEHSASHSQFNNIKY